MDKVKAAGIYARISLDDDGQGAGVKRQLTDCRKAAKEQGWPIVDEYVDNDVSAYSGKRRPAFERMLADLAAGTIDGVVTYHTDRLARSLRDSERFLDTVTATNASVRFVVGSMD